MAGNMLPASAHDDLPRVFTGERPAVRFKTRPEDFEVEEQLGFEFTGDGEHLVLLIEKRGLNTRDVVNRLCRLTGVARQDIGYAGLKDKLALTRQWFSLRTPRTFESGVLESEDMRVLSRGRNSRKIRIGSHRGNRFRIRLRQCGDVLNMLQHRLDRLAGEGVPNYFGPQRFGQDGGNVASAESFFTGKLPRSSPFLRGVYLSAARGWLFNRVLARRVTEGDWNACREGDVMALEGSGSVFRAESGDEALFERLARLDIHPTGPLWGKGEPVSGGAALALEKAVAAAFPVLSEGLAQFGLKQERRPLRLKLGEPAVRSVGAGELVVEFSLPRGAYATTVLREIVSSPGL